MPPAPTRQKGAAPPPPPADHKADGVVTPDVEIIFDELKSWLGECERAVAGFVQMQAAWLLAGGHQPTNTRVRGYPILEGGGTADGHDVLRVHYDLKMDLSPSEIQSVTLPLMHQKARQLLNALPEVEERFADLKAAFSFLTQPQPQPE